MNTPPKEWAKLFLENWDRAVELWNNGILFERGEGEHPYKRDRYKGYTLAQVKGQQEYAALCVTWLIPNGMVEPHCAAQGE